MKWHLITSEYPPQSGGVSDYTFLLAGAMAAVGDSVQVWCPASQADTPLLPGVVVNRELGTFTPRDLRRAGSLLNQFPAPRRLLVQWVPHGYGYRAINLPFCLWLWQRMVLHGDQIELMVHEPYLAFRRLALRQNLVAVVHRAMTAILLRAASHVWMSIPAWENRLKPYALGRKLSFHWLPVVSNIPVSNDPVSIERVRARCLAAGRFLVGHFSTYDSNLKRLLLDFVPRLLNESQPQINLLLIGRRSVEMAAELIAQHASLAERILASGALPASELSAHLSACDVLVQPFIDGVSSRRTTVMAGLAHGLPIITTKGEHTEPLWEESQAVVLTPVDDVMALATETRKLLVDANRQRKLGKAARKLYQSHFTIERIVEMLRAEAT